MGPGYVAQPWLSASLSLFMICVKDRVASRCAEKVEKCPNLPVDSDFVRDYLGSWLGSWLEVWCGRFRRTSFGLVIIPVGMHMFVWSCACRRWGK